MAHWNGLDFLIFVILALNTILGLSRGATRELISIICLSLALIITIKFTVPLATFFNSSPIMHDVVNNRMMQSFMSAIGAGSITISLLNEIMYSVSMLICFVGIFSLCEAALSAQFFIEFFSFPYAALNRKIGGTLGFTRGYIICLIMLSILTHLYNASSLAQTFMSGSLFANLFRTQVQTLDQMISSQNPEYYQRLYQDQPVSEQIIYDKLGNPNMPLVPQGQPQTGASGAPNGNQNNGGGYYQPQFGAPTTAPAPQNNTGTEAPTQPIQQPSPPPVQGSETPTTDTSQSAMPRPVEPPPPG